MKREVDPLAITGYSSHRIARLEYIFIKMSSPVNKRQ